MHPTVVLDDILTGLGYDPHDQHLRDTARRWLQMLDEFRMPKGTVYDVLGTEFEDDYGGMVVVGNIKFAALCAHHLAPFQGVAHVAYLPNGKVVGISKIARLVEFWTHRITVQEVATRSIVDSIQEVLKPRGAFAMLRAAHTCMSVRGIRSTDAMTTTADVTGLFKDDASGCKQEALSYFMEK